ncbi:hypothetical protein ONZ51_g6737 [Trametes cubensis]|uniref:O-methyltransferase C-terminal domain-containing protein n=1 Tax=Trametes cubensis TaxID=1111947 RepID=A0AAD7TSK7_9APHY|nr:hypothetical protein ONZ51_g6737 [Trametes cubensis]
MMTFATLRALHVCIGDAINDLARIYEARSPSALDHLDYPSLDVPHYPNAPLLPAEELSEELINDPSALLAIRHIVAACGQLCATVSRPGESLIDIAVSVHLQSCMRFMEAAHIVEILREAGPQGMHVDGIHRWVVDLRPQNAQPNPATLSSGRLAHVLRVLATAHWLREVSPDVFANNRRSSALDTGKTLDQLRAQPEKKYSDTNGLAAAVGQICEYSVSSKMTEWFLPDVRERRLPNRASRGADSTSVLYPTAFNLEFNTDFNFFEWLDLPVNAFDHERFAHAMNGTSNMEGRQDILQAFPWETLSPDAVVVDVGGGIGTASLTVAHAYPDIQVVVEDRAPVVEIAPAAWGEQYAHIITSGRISWRTRDFFTSWQPLPNGKTPNVFLLRTVLHDWPDDASRTILRHLRQGAGPETKLVIGDALLLPACKSSDPASLVAEDSPLLPNLGMASMQLYLVDIMDGMSLKFGLDDELTDSEGADR